MFETVAGGPCILLQNVEHRYRVIFERPDTLRETFVHLFQKRSHFKEFTVLRDLNLEVEPGETVGIVGRNGSGKSTLLKLVAGIFKAARGRVVVRGQVASLIELGAGFIRNSRVAKISN